MSTNVMIPGSPCPIDPHFRMQTRMGGQNAVEGWGLGARPPVQHQLRFKGSGEMPQRVRRNSTPHSLVTVLRIGTRAAVMRIEAARY